MDQSYRAQFINSLSGYKSLQMVGSINPHGKSNLGLFNSIFHLGANPPLVGMIFRPVSADHDTLGNVIATGQYTLNNVTSSYYLPAHQTSARYPSGVSEFEKCGFTERYVDGFKAPFVAESTISMGIELREVTPVKLNKTSLVIGEIMYILLSDLSLVSSDGFIDPVKAGTVTVAGLDSYFTTTALARLAYAKPDEQPHALEMSL